MHKCSKSSGYTYSLWEAHFYTMKYKIFRDIYHGYHGKYTNILPWLFYCISINLKGNMFCNPHPPNAMSSPLCISVVYFIDS